MTTPYDDLIQTCSNTYGLPFQLLQAQVIRESSGHADAFRYEPAFYDHYLKGNSAAKSVAYGPLGACSYGLLQIMLETAMEIGFSDRPEALFRPSVGLAFGCKKMQLLWQNVGGSATSYRTALARYNGAGAQADAYAASIYTLAGVAA
jgi:hypothetical protein